MEHILARLAGQYEIVPEGEERDFVDYRLIDNSRIRGKEAEGACRGSICLRMPVTKVCLRDAWSYT